MNNLIQQLKDNRYEWGLWFNPECYGSKLGAEMQAKAKQIGRSNFEYFDGTRWIRMGQGLFNASTTDRLRADYEEKPEIVECEIFGRDMGCLGYNISQDGDEEPVEFMLDEAVKHPDFIGFKCEDWIWGRAYKNKHTGIISIMIRADKLDEYDVCDMTQAHVLFRKQE